MTFNQVVPTLSFRQTQRLVDLFRDRHFQILDIRKNRLQDFPPDIGILSRLKRLELDGG